ncbi:hypothetical protein L493_0817 [Bordetella bronchiseptica 99-R-0433]|nr:hypothetical protein L493_0817 [Bordetella bronchiseptica 99-R-0433]
MNITSGNFRHSAMGRAADAHSSLTGKPGAPFPIERNKNVIC